MAFTIDGGLCPQNHRCPLIAACPAEAISQAGHGLPAISAELCVECGRCVAMCPKKAVRKSADNGTAV